MASSNSLSSDRYLRWALCLALVGCSVPDYQVWQGAPTGDNAASGGSSAPPDGGTRASSYRAPGGSSGEANTVTAQNGGGGSGGRAVEALTYPSGFANLGGSVADGNTQAVGGLGHGGLSAATSRTPTGGAETGGAILAPFGGALAAGRANSAGSDTGGRAATELAASGSHAIAGSSVTSGGIAATGNMTAGRGGTSSQHLAGAGGGGTSGGNSPSGGKAGSAGNANVFCASYTDLGTLSDKGNIEQFVPIAATCYRFTVADQMTRVQGMGMYGCDTRQGSINGIDCTAGCSASLPIERSQDGFWYVEFAAGRSSSCKGQWWWY